MKKAERAVLRNKKIGFVFQNYNLLPKTTSIESVEKAEGIEDVGRWPCEVIAFQFVIFLRKFHALREDSGIFKKREFISFAKIVQASAIKFI